MKLEDMHSHTDTHCTFKTTKTKQGATLVIYSSALKQSTQTKCSRTRNFIFPPLWRDPHMQTHMNTRSHTHTHRDKRGPGMAWRAEKLRRMMGNDGKRRQMVAGKTVFLGGSVKVSSVCVCAWACVSRDGHSQLKLLPLTQRGSAGFAFFPQFN